MSDKPDFWEGTAPVPDSQVHEMIIWISLDSLTSFWKPYPVFHRNLGPLSAAARNALRDYHDGRATSVENAFFDEIETTVSADDVAGIRRFFDAVVAMDLDRDLGYWTMWFSQNQHRPHIPGFDPTRAHLLMAAYREEVVRVARSLRAALEKKVVERPLSDWDMFIHHTYGYCYYQSDQFDKSPILIGVGGVQREFLFNAFLAKHVLTLSEDDQRLLLDAVREEERAALAEPPMDAITAIFRDKDMERGGADAIPPARDVVQWF